MQGSYEFKFGSSTVSLQDKLKKVSTEPVAYHLYKRRDLESKIDKLAIEKLRMAKMVFNVTQQARKDRQDYLEIKALRRKEKLEKKRAQEEALKEEEDRRKRMQGGSRQSQRSRQSNKS